jgi:cytochrome oxidase Cu insertion factor (SCO1/SenC/PrrC family)
MTEEARHSVTRLAALVAAGALIVAACGSGSTGGSAAPAASAPSESAGASAGSESPGESPSGSGSGFQFEQLGGQVSVVG